MDGCNCPMEEGDLNADRLGGKISVPLKIKLNEFYGILISFSFKIKQRKTTWRNDVKVRNIIV